MRVKRLSHGETISIYKSRNLICALNFTSGNDYTTLSTKVEILYAR